jgi:hypothetical protein
MQKEQQDKPTRRWVDQEKDLYGTMMQLLVEIREDVQSMKVSHVQVSEAFIKDDLGKPDYHGHRKAHLDMVSQSKVVDSYKQDATKKVIGIFVVFVIGLLAAGFMEALRK